MREFIVEADGGSRGNPGPAGYGAVVFDAATGQTLAERSEYLGVVTNNVAEYRGLLAGLRAAFDLDPTATVHVRMDSKLVVEQMSGRWKIKHPDMKPLAMEASRVFPPERVTYEWIPRERNKVADRLANEAMDAGTSGTSRGSAASGASAVSGAVVGGPSVESGGPVAAGAVARGTGAAGGGDDAGAVVGGAGAAGAVAGGAGAARPEAAGADAARADAATAVPGGGDAAWAAAAGADAAGPAAAGADGAGAATGGADAAKAVAAGPAAAGADGAGAATGGADAAKAVAAGPAAAEADAATDPAKADADVRAAKTVASPGWAPADMGAPATFVLLRHGETALTPQKRFSGSGGSDPVLSEIGRDQAERVGAALARRGTIQAIVASPLARTRETAAAVARRLGLEVAVDEGLRETDFGAWEGLTFGEVRDRYPDDLNAWLADPEARPTGNGESFTETATRIAATRDKLIAAYAGRTVLLVSHVTPIKTFVRLALGAPPESLFRMELSAASLSAVAYYADGNASVRLFNDTSHLR
ncbi:bifunctional RNase H/acid phosphatase [Streptomyces sp. NPDC002779]|uniref:bifunctional RNase H/acid phosphatase n=1 Tax=Streptomyces sp. NPDC002779 TaxID=3364664 RepID=UPI00368C3AFC